MIIKGASRAGPEALGSYLATSEVNERIEVLEIKGTISRDLTGALLEMDAYAAGTRCEKPLYHAQISPEPPYRLTPEQRMEAVDAVEKSLGLEGRARAVVVHEKLGREHLHVVWSRIDVEKNRSVSDSHNYRKHEEAARDLERRFGHPRVQGAHHEREGVERPDRSPSRSDLRQEERTGIKGRDVKIAVTEAFRASDGPQSFKSALEDRGYTLAQGDRRDFVVLDSAGGVHSLARRIDGVNATELRDFMKPLARANLPTVEQAQEMIEAREHGEVSAYDQNIWDDALAASAIKKDKSDRDLEWKHKREKSKDKADNAIERAYGSGDGYVTQSTAAQNDFERRQKALNPEDIWRPQHPDTRGLDDAAPDDQRPTDDDERQMREDHEKGAAIQKALVTPLAADPTGGKFNNVEITDRMQRLLSKSEDGLDHDDRDEESSDRHGEAPGAGRTRGRFE